MKKFLITLSVLGALLNAQNPINLNDDPFAEIEKMQKDMDAIFDKMAKSNIFTIAKTDAIMSSGIKDKGDHYEVVINLGKGKVKSSVKVKDRLLYIAVKSENRVENNSTNGFIKTQSNSSMTQIFTLPQDADTKIDYKQDGDKLIVKIPKVKK